MSTSHFEKRTETYENENIYLLSSLRAVDLDGFIEHAWDIIDVGLMICRFQCIVARLSAVHIVNVQ